MTTLDPGNSNTLAAFKGRGRKLLLRDGKNRRESNVLVSLSSHLFSHLGQFLFFLSHTPGFSFLFLSGVKNTGNCAIWCVAWAGYN
jgi:hypothetical protein